MLNMFRLLNDCINYCINSKKFQIKNQQEGNMSLKGTFKKLLIIILFISMFVLQQSFAQGTGAIKGTVYDKTTKDELPGANIIVKGTNIGTASNLDGKFILRDIPEGKQTIVTSYVGYEPQSMEIDIVANRTIEIDFNLSATALEGQEVVVTGQAQGQLQAINQQLTSDRISNVVSEQRIQQLPDYNAASALSRLPGISTQQSSGEDNKVVIRGMSPKYNAIEIDGIRLNSTGSSSIGLTSDTYVTTNGVQNDRSVDLTMISPYMLKMISVYKDLTPDMNANSIGGTVNMELREAPSDTHYDLLWQQGYTSKSKTYGNYKAVASGSSRFFDGKFGVYALLTAESYNRNADNINANYGVSSIDFDPVTGYRPVSANTVTFDRHLEVRNRYGGNLILDYQLPNGSIKFVNLLARINEGATENQQTLDYAAGRLNWTLRVGETNIDQRMHSLRFNYDLGFLTADLSATYNFADNVLDKQRVINFNQVSALAGAPHPNMTPEELTYLLPTFNLDSSVVLRSGNLFSNNYQDDKYTYKGDFQVPFNFGTQVNGFFKFGGQYDKKSISTDQEAPYLGFNGSATDPNATGIQANLMRTIQQKYGISVDGQGNLTGVYFKNTNSDLYASFLDNKYGSLFYAADGGLLTDIINYISSNPAFDASNSQYSTGAVGGWYNGPYQKLTNDYNYHENYYATYALSKINFLDFMVIGGVRYEKVHSEYFAYNARDQRNAQSQVMYDTTSINENEFVLPMVQMKYSPFDWMDIRYAYTQTLARPDYSQLTPKFTITQGNQIFAGNPDLKPAKAFNHDVNLTFYANKLGLFEIGGFYKTIDNFVYSAQYRLDAAEGAGLDALSNYQIVRNGAYVVTPVLTNGKSDAQVFKPLNNPYEATVKGIEVDFQHSFWYLPQPFNNLIVGLNYTRIWSETKYPYFDVRVVSQPRPLPPLPVLVDSSSTGRLLDQPNHIFNSWIGYDYEGFSSRLSFQFRAGTNTRNGGVFPETDASTKDYFRIDFQASQKLPWFNSELSLNIVNLNDVNTTSIQRSISGFTSIENYGLTANLGLRVRY